MTSSETSIDAILSRFPEDVQRGIVEAILNEIPEMLNRALADAAETRTTVPKNDPRYPADLLKGFLNIGPNDIGKAYKLTFEKVRLALPTALEEALKAYNEAKASPETWKTPIGDAVAKVIEVIYKTAFPIAQGALS